jgi:hypothetical protein
MQNISPLLVLSPTSESSSFNAVGDNTNSGMIAEF